MQQNSKKAGPIDPSKPFGNFTSGAGALSTSPASPGISQHDGVASLEEKQLAMTKKFWYKPKFSRTKACGYIVRAGGWVVRQNSKGGLALTVCKDDYDPKSKGTAGADRFYHTLIQHIPGKKKVADSWSFANADTDLRFTSVEQLMASGIQNSLEYFSVVMEMPISPEKKKGKMKSMN